MTVDGRVEGALLKVKTKGPIPMLNIERPISPTSPAG